MKQYVLGISGGHHVSEAIALDLSSFQLTPVITGQPFNIHRLKPELASIRIATLLNNLALHFGLSDSTVLRAESQSWIFALPGAFRRPDKAEAIAVISGAGWRRDVEYVVDDTIAGLFVETIDFRGVCAFAGTGASVLRATGIATQIIPDQSHLLKIDGWGPVIGDYGSSFGIVANYFRHLRRVLDRGGKCPYFETIKAVSPKIKSEDYIQYWFDGMLVGGDPEWPVRFASLAKIIAIAADEEKSNDSLATKLIYTAADEIVESIKIACKGFGEEAVIPLVLQGALFRHCRKFRERVIFALTDYRVKPVVARASPVCGALLLALRDQPSLLKKLHEHLKTTRNDIY